MSDITLARPRYLRFSTQFGEIWGALEWKVSTGVGRLKVHLDTALKKSLKDHYVTPTITITILWLKVPAKNEMLLLLSFF